MKHEICNGLAQGMRGLSLWISNMQYNERYKVRRHSISLKFILLLSPHDRIVNVKERVRLLEESRILNFTISSIILHSHLPPQSKTFSSVEVVRLPNISTSGELQSGRYDGSSPQRTSPAPIPTHQTSKAPANTATPI